jgi:hypothetical protein
MQDKQLICAITFVCGRSVSTGPEFNNSELITHHELSCPACKAGRRARRVPTLHFKETTYDAYSKEEVRH